MRHVLENLAETQTLSQEIAHKGITINAVNPGPTDTGWMDEKLALKFAAWLDVDFELWVYDTIDEIMFGEYRIHEAALQQTLKAEKEIEKLQVKLAENPDFQRIQALEKFIKTKICIVFNF